MRSKNKVHSVLSIIIILAVILGSIGLPGKKAGAVSAAMNLALSDETILADSTFSVVLTIESSEDIGNVETFLTFDTKKLQFVEGGVSVTGGKGVVYISDKDSKEETSKKKYSMKFKAIKGGETTIAIDDDPKISCALDGLYMSVSRNQLLFEITDPERISDDAELMNLTVFPGTLTPEFKNTVTKYTMEVASDVDEIAVDARPYDEDATVAVTGNTKLMEGKNKIKIVVTAPAGNQETITITVTKKKEAAEEAPEKEDSKTSDKVSEDGLDTLGAKVTAGEDDEGNVFLSQFLKLKVLPVPDEDMIPDDYEETTVVIDGYPITVYTWKHNLNGDLLLLYGENQDGKEGLYQYSREGKTLNEYTGEGNTISESRAAVENTKESENYKRKLFQMGMGLVALMVICIILSVLLAFQAVKNKREEDFF